MQITLHFLPSPLTEKPCRHLLSLLAKKRCVCVVGLEKFTADMEEMVQLTLILLGSGRDILAKDFIHMVQNKLNHQLLNSHLLESCISIAAHRLYLFRPTS